MRLLLILVAVCMSGCAILPRNAVPIDRMHEAVIPGMPDVRALAGSRDPAMMSDLAQSFMQESPADFPVQADGRVHYPHLVLSGGGANGAFGAGFLSGWTASGKRLSLIHI